MNRTSKIVSGVALLLFGIGWMLEIMGIINVNFNGWWTVFIIVPCLASFFSYENKGMSVIGVGLGVLLLLASRGTIAWNDFWKYIICLVAVVWGVTLIFGRNSRFYSSPDRKTVNEMKRINQNGRNIRQINVSFGKQLFEFPREKFEGANVQTNFGFVALDLRSADIIDGAVINVDCRFGGMEIRFGDGICVKQGVEATFAGIENRRSNHSDEAMKTVYLNGKCSFGGIEVK